MTSALSVSKWFARFPLRQTFTFYGAEISFEFRNFPRQHPRFILNWGCG